MLRYSFKNCIVCGKHTVNAYACMQDEETCWSNLPRSTKDSVGNIGIPDYIPDKQVAKYINEKIKQDSI